MVAIVVAVGVARSWRASLVGAGAGLIVLAALVAALGTAVRNVPLSPVRLVVGALLLVFGLQWLRKGVLRVARDGWGVGHGAPDLDAAGSAQHRFDWTGFVLSFKGVSLEGLEVAVIVVAFGAAAGAVGSAVVGAAASIIILSAGSGLTYRLVARIPRRALQLFVGAMLTTFGTFWAGEGLGVAWPGEESALLALGAVYVLAALGLVRWMRAARPRTTFSLSLPGGRARSPGYLVPDPRHTADAPDRIREVQQRHGPGNCPRHGLGRVMRSAEHRGREVG
jgi:uncharacterized membrane protein